jgi:hypothetical protein
MSTLTDAIEKRKKEAGEDETRELVPVSLDEPDVEVPNEKRSRRVGVLVVVLLLMAGVAVGSVFLFRELRGGKTPARRAGEPVRTASLSPAEEKEALAREAEEPLPLPETPAGASAAPAEAPSPAPGTSPATQPTAPGTTRPAAESPPTTAPAPRPEAASFAPPAPGAVSEPPEPPQADPFAGVKLQGIIHFDPATPEVMINGRTLKVGESLDGIEIVEIGTDSVKLRHGTIEKTITYR